MRRLGAVAIACVACGAAAKPTPRKVAAPPATAIERMLPLLPDGSEVVVELDLARLRANAVVGDVATRALAQLGADAHVPGLPLSVAGSPLGNADAIVLAAYGVGTAQAATITLLTTHADVPGGTRLSPELVVLAPDEWVAQVQARAAVKTRAAAPELLRLRAHAMPAGATGAIVRISARLSFDARISLARQIGVDAAPAQLSVWADVADDFAMVVDVDASDPGGGRARDAARAAARTMTATIRSVLDQATELPLLRSLGVLYSMLDARYIVNGSWVRTVIAVGPRHLARVVERGRAMLASGS